MSDFRYTRFHEFGGPPRSHRLHTKREALAMRVKPAMFGRLLRMFFGPHDPRPLYLEEQRWEDDGGPPFPEPVPYTHTIGPAREVAADRP